MDKTNNPVAVEERLYRWVKLGDRLPKKNKILIVRNNYDEIFKYYHDHRGEFYKSAIEPRKPENRIDNIYEFLEETPIKEHPVVEDSMAFKNLKSSIAAHNEFYHHTKNKPLEEQPLKEDELWKSIESEISDILFDTSGTISETSKIMNYLKQFSIKKLSE